MEKLLEEIRAATGAGATAEARAAGANACRVILTALEGAAGEPLVDAAAVQPSQVATIVGALRGVPPDQLLDLAIAKLRAAIPPGVEVAPVKALKFNIVPVPRRG